VLEGEGAMNDIQQGNVQAPSVRVEDEAGRPLSGIAVLFALPERGAGGIFTGGLRTLSVQTDARGVAVASFRPNSIQGPFQIRVTASIAAASVTAVINQRNFVPILVEVPQQPRKSSRKGLVLGIAAGAAAAGLVFGLRGGGKSSVSTPVGTTTITAGGPTVGPPR